MKKILFVVDNMAFGGVSNALCETLNRIDYNKYQIDLLVLHQIGEVFDRIPTKVCTIYGPPFFHIIDQKMDVLLKNINVSKLIKKVFMSLLLKTGLIIPILKQKRSILLTKKYDIEIAYKDGFCTIFTSASEARMKIAWIHNDYMIFKGVRKYKSIFSKSLKKMDKIIAVSMEAAHSAQNSFFLTHLPDIVPNPVDSEKIIKASMLFEPSFNEDTFNFVSVGRLNDQKGYDRLIRVHSYLISQGYLHHIYIVGSGDDELMLCHMIDNLGLNSSFILLGFQSNPYPFIRKADCYIMSSRHEASPLVIIESLILHKPIISTNVADVKERLANGLGLVVENSEEALFEGMKNILIDKSQLRIYQENLASYLYDNDAIMKKIEEIWGL